MDNSLNIPTFGMPLRGLLLVSGIYTFIWGAFFKWFGNPLLKWLSMGQFEADLPTNWFGSFGMVVGVCIFLSAFYPLSWFYLMLAGAVGKLISLGWFLFYYIGNLGWNKRSIFHLTFNEILWIILLTVILSRAFKTKNYVKTLPS
ncbi:hypothetical protein [Lunatibacter salilacus]|uniref:hypothetical protein n=1 Tax=Lunatibacter salilacus TaxID=2483804 RepID=UPI00131E6452|nr:hypothetical protein [Lunatibacter salilacus]